MPEVNVNNFSTINVLISALENDKIWNDCFPEYLEQGDVVSSFCHKNNILFFANVKSLNWSLWKMKTHQDLPYICGAIETPPLS